MLKHISRVDWKQERLIWIAFLKNNDNDECLFPLLPKDIVLEIIKFFKTNLRLDNFSRTDYHENNKDTSDIDVGDNNVEKNDKSDERHNNLTIAIATAQDAKQTFQNDQTSTSNTKFHCCCWKR